MAVRGPEWDRQPTCADHRRPREYPSPALITVRTAAAAVLASVLVAGCGGGGGETSTSVSLPAGCAQVQKPAPKDVHLTRPTTIRFDGCRQRHVGRIERGAQAAGLSADRAAGLAVAVNEVSTAAFGARGPMRIRLWAEPGAVICDIAGAATFENPMVGRSTAIAPDRRERGIRLANALCDLVQVRSRPGGSVIRLHHWIGLV